MKILGFSTEIIIFHEIVGPCTHLTTSRHRLRCAPEARGVFGSRFRIRKHAMDALEAIATRFEHFYFS